MVTSTAPQPASPPTSEPTRTPAAPTQTSSTTSAPPQKQTLPLKVVFSGGLAPTFAPHPTDTHAIALPYSADAPPTAGVLVQHLTATLLRDATQAQVETFVLRRGDATPRPGILVLVNDADWELDGGPGWRLGAGDEVLFVSTLHGG